MKSKYLEKDFAACTSDLDRRVYTSRLLGQDKTLILHGGGNTSVKTIQPNAFGEEEEILLVKGSGWDLEKIEPEGFSPVKLGHLQRLAGLDALPDFAPEGDPLGGDTDEAEPDTRGLKEIVRVKTARLEKALIQKALDQENDNVTRAARRLEISRKSLQLKMKEYGLRGDEE